MLSLGGEEVLGIVLLLSCPLISCSRESTRTETKQRFGYLIITSAMLKIKRKEQGKRFFEMNFIYIGFSMGPLWKCPASLFG